MRDFVVHGKLECSVEECLPLIGSDVGVVLFNGVGLHPDQDALPGDLRIRSKEKSGKIIRVMDREDPVKLGGR